MHIKKWHQRAKLFAWQHKRSILLTLMFVAALLINFFLNAPDASPLLFPDHWPPEYGYVAIVGFFICLVVVIIND